MTTQDIAIALSYGLNTVEANHDLWPLEAYGVTWLPFEDYATFFVEINKGCRNQKTYRVRVEEL